MEDQNCSKVGKQNEVQHHQVAVVMVPFPAQGLLNQLLHLSHLITSYGLPVHYAGSASHNHQAKLRLHGWDSETSSKIHFHDFKIPPHSLSPPNPNPSTFFPTNLEPLFDASTHLRQPISQLLQELSTKLRRIIIIFDNLMTSVIQDVRGIPNAESYAFHPTSAFTKFLNVWEILPKKPFQLDFDVPKCIPSNEGCLTTKVINFLVKQHQLLGFEAGTLCNTSRLIEGRYVQLLENLSINPEMKYFAVGPLNPVEMESKNDRHICLQWLNEQEASSVIYVSFGSTTSMTDEQIMELALGLERSGQKFIWVLRRADKADVYSKSDLRNPLLPEGYEERLKNKGMVVRDWAPQLQILAHPSIGGFMSHCGWNSCMESISMGVPMAAWPMHSDQPRNATLVTEVLRIGTLVRDWAHRADLVTSATIENALRRLMASEEGKEMQKRAAELGDAVRTSVAEGGTSSVEMDSFIMHVTR
ncbi:zeatin O-glucosyltransferase-like [Chenopodium quinoa]|uniref:zeatin O-glucosyltransferase-like n=1 Tax=Chenopodium quinoa TaxID=63459 RepID=UPI000B7763A8|nr:zeatin O-glucosyltransferase-like [Chenopodium quinoa]